MAGNHTNSSECVERSAPCVTNPTSRHYHAQPVSRRTRNMATTLPDLDPATQRQLAAGLFNLVWKHLENPARTEAEDEAMLHAAHASRHHWTAIGTPLNRARGEWQISRVYAVLRRGEPALHHARRYLEMCGTFKLDPFDFGFAHEALARAAALAGDPAASERHVSSAREFVAQIDDAEDRQWLEENLRT